MIALVTTALAGFWHPVDLSRESAAYTHASQQTSDAAALAQERARTLAAALADFEEALDLLGDRAPADQRERHQALEKAYNRSFAEVQAFADTLVGDFDAAFQAAIDRALLKKPDAQRCQREIADGPQVPGMRPRTRANPDCLGDDLNAGLARAIDADPVLTSALKDLTARPWPAFALEPEPVAAVGGSGRWISVSGFWAKAAPKALRAIRNQDDDARITFQAAIEQGASKEQLAGLVDAARKVDADTRARRMELSGPIHARAEAVLSKKAHDVGWCAQPAALGGCVGTDQTHAVVELLLADKKLVGALP